MEETSGQPRLVDYPATPPQGQVRQRAGDAGGWPRRDRCRVHASQGSGLQAMIGDTLG